jgi:hypothetical protein
LKTKEELQEDVKDTLKSIKETIGSAAAVKPITALEMANAYTFNLLFLEVLIDMRDQIVDINNNLLSLHERVVEVGRRLP